MTSFIRVYQRATQRINTGSSSPCLDHPLLNLHQSINNKLNFHLSLEVNLHLIPRYKATGIQQKRAVAEVLCHNCCQIYYAKITITISLLFITKLHTST